VAVRLAREHDRHAAPEALVGRRHAGREHILEALGLERETEHGRPADKRPVRRIERIDSGHGRRADAFRQLVAVAGGGRREQVEQELRAPA
jgi:hypothetical protein